MEEKILLCEACGNMVSVLRETGVPVMCCGEEMTALVPGTVEASLEKHIPVYEEKSSKVYVQVGSAEHPMLEEHYIEWISLLTSSGCQRKFLKPGDAPKAVFALCENETVEAVYAYCNIHGLWKSE